MLSVTAHSCSKFILQCIDVTTVYWQCTNYSVVWDQIANKSFVLLNSIILGEYISRKTVFAICKFTAIYRTVIVRGVVLEDVPGHEDVLKDTFWSPWPWPRRSSPWPCPRGLKSSKISLSSARGQHFFLNCWNFVERLKKIFKRRFLLENAWKKFLKTFFLKSSEKKFWRPFFLETLALVSLVLGLGLEHFCSWPRECLSSETLPLASDFFCVLGLGLEACVLDSTTGNYRIFV